MCYKHFLSNVWRDFRLRMSALATAAGKSFNGKFTSKFDFLTGILYYYCWCWYWKSEVSPYIIWNRPVKRVAESSLKMFIISSRNGWALYQLDGFDQTWIIIRPTLFGKYLDHMLVKFEQNRMVQTIQNFDLFDKKRVNHFWQSVDAILEDVSMTDPIVWCKTIDVKTTIFQCSKNYGSPTCNQVKSCTKHGRLNQS